jgi:DNA repair protein RadC
MISPMPPISPMSIESLPDAQLVSLLVAGSGRAARLLGALGGPSGLMRAGLHELSAVGELTAVEAARLKAALELGRRAVDLPLERGDSITCAADVFARLRGRMGALEHEELHVLGLDTQNRVVCHFVPAVGSINQVSISAREVFRPLLREGAGGAIVVHNHPSGSSLPSPADADLTVRLQQAGALVGVPLLDHVIIARSGHYSFAEHGSLK